MKYKIFVFILGLFFTSTFGFFANAKELVVAHDTNLMPFEFKDKEGNFVGFDIELWEHIAEIANISYTFQPMDFNGIIPGLQTGNIDIAISGMTITPERAKVILFSQPYYESGLMILVRAGEDSISKLEDLVGKTVGVKTGTSSVDFMKSFGKQKSLKLFPTNDGMFFDLMTGGVDAVIFDAPVLQYFASSAGKGKVKLVGPKYKGQPYGIAFRKNSEELVQKVNTALNELKRNGIYTELYKKWFGLSPEEYIETNN